MAALRILHLEDDPNDAELIAEALRDAGIAGTTRRVVSEGDFCLALAEFHPDILLCDYRLPHFDGLSALKLARDACPELPVVMVTGAVGDEQAVELLKAGACDYVLKDRLARLGPAVQKALTEARISRDRRAAEAALLLSEVRYRRLFEAAREGILIVDAGSGAIIEANPYLIGLLGNGHQEWAGKKLWEIAELAAIAGSPTDFAALRAKGYTRHGLLPLKSRDGRIIEVEFTSDIYGAGDRTFLLCTIRDLTELMRMVTLLGQKSAELEEAQRVAHVGNWTLDAETGTVTWSAEIYRIFGRDPTRPPPKLAELDQILAPGSLALLRAAIDRSLRSGEPFNLDLEFIRPDGSPGWIAARGEPRGAEDGRSTGLRGTAADISERKRAEWALGERVKEQRCLHLVSALAARPELSEEALLGGALAPLAAAFQFPASAGARITYRQRELASPHFRLTPWRLASELRVGNAPEGRLEVCYLEEPPDTGAGPFLAEEQAMLEAVAGILGRALSAKGAARTTLERLTRSAAQAKALAAISASPALLEGNLEQLTRELTEQAAAAVGSERVNAWLFSPDESELFCLDLYEATPRRHSAGLVLSEAQYGKEFQALKGSPYVNADDPLTDPRTAGYVESYLKPLNITSMLDTVVAISGRHLGLLCFEHVGRAHHWEDDEISFACRLADCIALTLVNRQQRQAEKRFRALIENASDLVLTVSEAGLITYTSPSVTRLGGYEVAELLGRNYLDLTHPEDQAAAAATLAQVSGEPGRSATSEIRCRHKDGRWITLESVVRNACADPAVGGLVINARDITERKRLESQLRQAQKMEAIGTLAGGIAHDFNNILTAILGYGEIVMAALPQESPLREDQLEVLKAGKRARDLVRQILTFSRREEQELQPLHVQFVIKEALKLLRASIPANIAIRETIDGNCGLVLADPTMIHQVAMNICTNAYQAMREQGGTMTVSLRDLLVTPDDATHLGLTTGPHILLEVRDTGCGMSREERERLFEPYFTTKPKGEGTGLGMTLVHGIVTALGGRVNAYSEPGQGSTIKVYLPRIEMVEPETLPEDALPQGGHESVLAVDDEEAIVALEGRHLTGLGYRVTTCADSEEALRLFRANPEGFDLLLTDMTMPKLTGAGLAEEVLRLKPTLPIVLCTGFSEMIDAEKAKAAGIREFMTKPILKADLARSVRRALAGNSAGS